MALNQDLYSITGYDALQRRLAAITPGKGIGADIMRMLALQVRREAIARVPRKTGNLGRSIRVAEVTEQSATVIAGNAAEASYARYVEDGTGIYGPRHKPIVPVRAKILAWPRAGTTTLGGRVRSKHIDKATGKAGKGVYVFAMSVKGRPATPYMKPGAEAAISRAGLADVIVTNWNDAA